MTSEMHHESSAAYEATHHLALLSLALPDHLLAYHRGKLTIAVPGQTVVTHMMRTSLTSHWRSPAGQLRRAFHAKGLPSLLFTVFLVCRCQCYHVHSSSHL